MNQFYLFPMYINAIFAIRPSLTVVNVHIYKQITGIMQKLKYIYTYNDIQKIIF